MKNRTERLILFVVLMVGALVFGYVFSLFMASKQADAEVNANNERLLHNSIQDYDGDLTELVSRLVVSDMAFDSVSKGTHAEFFTKLCQLPKFRSQVASFGLLRNGREIAFLCNYGVVKKPDEHDHVAGEVFELSKDLLERIAKAQDAFKIVLSEFNHLTDYVTIDGRTYLVLVAAVSPETNRDKTRSYVPTLAFAMVSLDRTIVARVPETLSLAGFRVIGKKAASGGRYATAIKSRDGAPVAFLTWEGSKRFQSLLLRLLPSIGILTLILILLILRHLREIGKLQRIITAQEAESRHAALHDALTSLPNRAHFNDALRRATEQATPGAPCFIGFLDLDYFKQVNDTHGHAAGDALIVEAGDRVREILGDGDLMARLGGDEFACILRSISTESQAEVFCERLIHTIKQPFSFGDAIIMPSASLGIAACPEFGQDAESILKAADTALYDAKDGGRGRFSIYGKATATRTLPAAAE